MPHETPLISTLVAGFVFAFLLGAIANRFRMPPLVGYLVAGILVGPHTPGFVADQSLGAELSEIGVILLMFGVGLHFSLRDLMSVRLIALPGALVQIAFATLLGCSLGWLLGWSVGGSLVFGLALSVASTVVLLKALQERRLVETERGKIAVGWLIVEDLAMVLALVLIPAAASIGSEGVASHDSVAIALNEMLGLQLGIGGIIFVTLLKVATFVGVMLIFGRRLIPAILHRIAHTGSRELFRLGVLAIALGVAFGAAKLFGVSLALGAFFAGMILSESELSHRAAQESLPLRDAFSVLFFVSVGMLFNPAILVEQPLPLIATIFIIVIGKSLAAFVIVLLFRKGTGTALTISASLAQIGEFSFILAELGVGLKLLPAEARDLILAGAIFSIILNPLVFLGADRLRQLREESPGMPNVRTDDGATDTFSHKKPENTDLKTDSGLAVLIGYGRVGSRVGEALSREGKRFVVVEDNETIIEKLRAEGIDVIGGNAAGPEILKEAQLQNASTILVAIPNAFEAGQVVQTMRAASAGMRIICRAHSDEEVDYLTRLGASDVIMGESEIARGMIERMRSDALPSGAQ